MEVFPTILFRPLFISIRFINYTIHHYTQRYNLSSKPTLLNVKLTSIVNSSFRPPLYSISWCIDFLSSKVRLPCRLSVYTFLSYNYPNSSSFQSNRPPSTTLTPSTSSILVFPLVDPGPINFLNRKLESLHLQ